VTKFHQIDNAPEEENTNWRQFSKIDQEHRQRSKLAEKRKRERINSQKRSTAHSQRNRESGHGGEDSRMNSRSRGTSGNNPGVEQPLPGVQGDYLEKIGKSGSSLPENPGLDNAGHQKYRI